MSRRFSRRQFLGHTVSGTGAVLGAGFFVNPLVARNSSSPNERLNIASVGTRRRAGANLAGVSGENIVALVDVDARALEEVGPRYPEARRYRDFRVMLEKEQDKIDAVLVSTPDHIHAPATAMALRMKKHVYCEKPLAHTVFEARTVRELAKQNNLVTQMGTQIHAENNYRRVVELIQSGAIRPVRDVHVWSAASYSGSPLHYRYASSRLPGLGSLSWSGSTTSLQSGNSSRKLAKLLGFWYRRTGRFWLSLHGSPVLGAETAIPDEGFGPWT